jgi:hypothetical protein
MKRLETAKRTALSHLKKIENDFLRNGSIAIFGISTAEPRARHHAEKLATFFQKVKREPREFLQEFREDSAAQALFLTALNVAHEAMKAPKIKNEKKLDALLVAIILLAKAELAPPQEEEFREKTRKLAHLFGMNKRTKKVGPLEKELMATEILNQQFPNA